MAIEIKRPKEDRGQKWVWTQAALFILYIFLPPLSNPFWSSGVVTFGFLMMAWGAMFAIGALVNMVRLHGWRNLTSFPKPLSGLPLITDGAFAYVRHPIYFGIILMTLGYSVYTQNIPKIVAALCLFVFFDFKSRREEYFLNNTYPGYADYAQHVKRLIPGLY